MENFREHVSFFEKITSLLVSKWKRAGESRVRVSADWGEYEKVLLEHPNTDLIFALLLKDRIAL